MANRPITEKKLLQLRLKMVKHATHLGHWSPEDIASEYVVRLLEGLHQRATIGQAYIDIVRLVSGNKRQPGYKAKQALSMVASQEAQDHFTNTQPSVIQLTQDEMLDLEKACRSIKCTRSQFIVHQLLLGFTQREIANELGLTEGRVNQLVHQILSDLSVKVVRSATHPIRGTF